MGAFAMDMPADRWSWSSYGGADTSEASEASEASNSDSDTADADDAQVASADVPAGDARLEKNALIETFDRVCGARGSSERPSVCERPSPDQLRAWVQFEKSLPDRGVYVYVDGENVLKSFEISTGCVWPGRMTGRTIAAIAASASRSWLGPAVSSGADAVFVVYTKRPRLANPSDPFTFLVPMPSGGPKAGDEVDDALCAAAACVRLRGTGRDSAAERRSPRVCLVSGDEMHWMKESGVRDWTAIDRGPRGDVSAGNRLSPAIYADFASARRNCQAYARSVDARASALEAAARASDPSVSDGNAEDAKDASERRGASSDLISRYPPIVVVPKRTRHVREGALWSDDRAGIAIAVCSTALLLAALFA